MARRRKGSVMSDLLASFGGAVISLVGVGFAAMLGLGLPLALFEGLFGRGTRGKGGGLYRSDRSAQELYERRLRDSRHK